MDNPLLTLTIAFVVMAAASVGGFFLLRRIFTHVAERMADHIDRALGRVAGAGLTRLEAYAAAQGVPEATARAQFQRSIARLSRIMDSLIRLPLVGGVGLDSLLGLFPVAGDTLSAAVSVSLIVRSLRYGVPREIITKMLANVLVDLILGSVPVVGDLADMWFKANDRNVALLEEYLGGEARPRD